MKIRVAIGILVFWPLMAGATTRSVTSSGNWTNATIWASGAPVPDDDVTIGGGFTVTADVSTVSLNSLTNNGTLVFSGWDTVITSTTVAVNGTVTHLPNTDSGAPWVPDARVHLVCSNLTVAAGGSINVDEKGYRGGNGAGGNASGPGGGIETWVGSGGGYGGMGGRSTDSAGGTNYGTADSPMDPGSGAGGRNTGIPGNSGGGLVLIEASGLVTVNGTISANGGYYLPNLYAGGASGGGVNIQCRSFAGGGIITASGGRGTTDGGNRGGGGGGGRIAVAYNIAAQAAQNAIAKPTVQFGANAGPCYGGALIEETPYGSQPGAYGGQPGTIYLTDGSFMLTPVIQGGQYIVPGFTSAAVPSLIISNGLAVFTNGFQLTVSNNLTIANDFAGLWLTNGTLRVNSNMTVACSSHGHSYLAMQPGSSCTISNNFTVGTNYTLRYYGCETSPSSLEIGGSLIATNSGRFYVYSGMTNGASPNYGNLVTVTGGIVVGANSWILPNSHRTNGGSALFRSASVTLLGSTGGFNANGGGFSGGFKAGTNGYGPGGGTNGWVSSGAGYGGAGGRSVNVVGGPTYGSAAAPVDPGSGAGGRDNGASSVWGNYGGGVVRIETPGRVTVNGRISADAAVNVDAYGGGGAGGSVYIICDTFAGTNGLVTANGGPGNTDGANKSGGGGGGRIAIYYTNAAAQAALNASNRPTVVFGASGGPCALGANYEEYAYRGGPGTIYFSDDAIYPYQNLQGGQLIIPGKTAFTFDSLTITNGLASLPAGSTVTVSNNLTIQNNWSGIQLTNATLNILGSLNVTGATTSNAFSYIHLTSGVVFTVSSNVMIDKATVRLSGHATNLTTLTIGGSIRLTNGGALHLYAGMTNPSGPDYGLRVDVANDIVTSAGSWLYPWSHPTNGGSPYFTVRDVSVGTNSGFNATGTGPLGGNNGGICWGYGAGAGYKNSGGGYGGGGGTGTYGGSGTPGGTYGSSNAPIDAGSGGGGYNAGHIGTAGGGLIRIAASGTITVKGTCTASGQNSANVVSGSGSGGGIYIRCRRFSGDATGMVKADGGNAWTATTDNGGSGGGGRIAIWSLFNEYAGNYSVTNGNAYPGRLGTPGTLVIGYLRPPGTVFVIH